MTTSPSDVYNSPIALNTAKAPGPDDITLLLLKTFAVPLTLPLTHLLALALPTVLHVPCRMNGKSIKLFPFPKVLIHPMFKITDQFYACASSLKSWSQLYTARLLISSSPPSPHTSKQQLSFLSNRSCLSQLLSSYSYIFNAVDSKTSCVTVFLNFRKAFNTIPHPELLFKLWSHGITSSLWNWFHPYLSNCSHLVYIDVCSSTPLPVKSGVPQGTVLGPLLFLIYVNDIPNCVTFCTPYLFADDTKLIKVVCRHTRTTILQQDLISLYTWCSKWEYHLKVPSVQPCDSPSPPLPLRISVNGQPTQPVINHKDLGITVCNNLSWSDHITGICAKAYKSLHLIRQSISSSPSNAVCICPLFVVSWHTALSYGGHT